jgi:hypothetical protein
VPGIRARRARRSGDGRPPRMEASRRAAQGLPQCTRSVGGPQFRPTTDPLTRPAHDSSAAPGCGISRPVWASAYPLGEAKPQAETKKTR